MFNNKKGFTLIELLVVIAIIGLLSSIVLASLNSARAKGADAAVKQNLAGIRAQAEILYDNAGGNYNAVCGIGAVQDPTVLAALNAASFAGAGNTTSDVCGAPAAAPATGWAATAPLKSAGAWCVDSSGVSRSATAAGVAYTATIAATGALTSATDLTCN
jgi:prepilin-type N-terminal cleavage/methylation domain-containing protein